MGQFKARIILNKKIAPEHYVLSFKAPKIARKTKPGQFFNIKVNNSYEPFLRRPFSAHKIGKDKIEILYKVVGHATRILSAKKSGEVLDIIGPLGNGFSFHPRGRTYSTPGVETVILVAGGHGVAPLLALAKQLTVYSSQLTAFIGARTKKHIVCDKDFRKLGAKVYVATEDGSRGYKGLVTDLLNKKLKGGLSINRQVSKPASRQTIYACGPKSMLKEVAKLAKRHRIPCRVSFEEYMACGIGTCLGCAVKTQAGFKLVCKDGPIFDAKEIVWQT